MKILMLRPSYVPEISGGTHLAVDLVEDIIKENNEIKLVVPSPIRVSQEIKEKFKKNPHEVSEDGKLSIIRVQSGFGEKNLVTRALRMLIISVKMFWIAITERDIDVIVSHSMPVFLGPLAALAGKLRKVPVIYWEQDIVSESLISTGVSKGKSGKILYKFAELLEQYSSKNSTHIVTISEEFKKRQINKLKKSSNDVDVVYNWIDINQVYPVSRNQNFLFDKYNLDRNSFYVTYCGNLGLPQNVEILVDAAKELTYIEDLKFVIFGNGVRRKYIEDYIKNSKLNNVLLLPLQPLEHSAYVYSLGDVGVVIGRKGTSRNGFPSKTWSIMAAGQAMISCFDEDSELSHFVRDGECGISILPDSSEELSNTVKKLYGNKDMTKRYGKNSRDYVSDFFSREIATKKFINIVYNVASKFSN